MKFDESGKAIKLESFIEKVKDESMIWASGGLS